jgi:ParB-like chromosome segregation protein Spo0J
MAKTTKAAATTTTTRQIEQRQIAALVRNPNNPRTHSDAQVDQIAASIREYGWTNPVLIDEVDCVIAGYGRLAGAERLGLTAVPVIVLAGLTEAQKRAYLIADNKLALNAAWDDSLLKYELSELQELGADLALTGFSADELNVIFNGWSSDIDLAEKHDESGSNAVDAVLKISVPAVAKDQAKEVVTNALDAAGVSYAFR